MPIELRYISDFLSTVEGPCQTVGYIPCNKVGGGTANYKGKGDPELYRAMGVSGVTIATGCDLGQTTLDTLTGYGLDSGIAHALVPYIGLKQDAALRKLHELPLTVSLDSAYAIDRAVHAGYLSRYVIPAYDNFSPKHNCVDLPKQAQAVIMSLCFQLGCGGLKRRAPKTWAALCRGDWADASERLCNASLWEGYQGRRRQEGLLLKEVA